MKKRPHIIALAALSALCAAQSVFAVVINLSPAKDNTLYVDQSGSTSNGAGNYLFAGNTAFSETRRALLSWDIAAGIPAGSTINSVSLTLNMSRCGPTCGTSVIMDLHKVDADWGEGTSLASGQEGIPAQAEPGDATWLNTFYPGSFWQTPGGDFSPTVSGSQVVTNLGVYTWASTGQMVADAQDWLDNPGSNFGWLLMGGEDAATTAKRFNSRTNPTGGTRPVLSIDYTPVPEPSTILFVAAGALGMFRFRRRNS